MFDQGEIVVVPFPFSDLTGVKQRPVLVLSKRLENNLGEDIIVYGITSNLRDSKYSVPLGNENLENGLIPAKSKIKVDKLFTLDKKIVKKRVARINKKTFSLVVDVFKNLV